MGGIKLVDSDSVSEMNDYGGRRLLFCLPLFLLKKLSV